MTYIQLLGRRAISGTQSLGRAVFFFLSVLRVYARLPVKWNLFYHQLYSVGFQSLIIIVVSSMFIGMVLGLQGYIILAKFGADQAVGQLVALSLVRELAPVIAALLFAGRAGSALTAELGLMKATEQISSLEVMGINPIARIVAPRFWAGQICLPLLVIIFMAVAILGGSAVCVSWLGVDSGAFWANMQDSVDWYSDVINGVIKGAIFATAVTWIALYQGMNCEESSYGISAATTKTVVYSSVVVLILDFFITALMFGGFGA